MVVSAGDNHNIEVSIAGSEGMIGVPVLPVFGRRATVHTRVWHCNTGFIWSGRSQNPSPILRNFVLREVDRRADNQD